FPMMDVQAFRGRFYNAKECKPNANMPVLVSSYGFWKRNGGRDDFVDSTLHINGQPYTVIGIAPDGIQRRERLDRAAYLAAARHSFAARFGFRRFRNYARPVGPKKLHLQSSGADAFRPDDRRGKSQFADAGATVKCDSTRRQRRFARAANSNAVTIQPEHAAGG